MFLFRRASYRNLPRLLLPANLLCGYSESTLLVVRCELWLSRVCLTGAIPLVGVAAGCGSTVDNPSKGASFEPRQDASESAGASSGGGQLGTGGTAGVSSRGSGGTVPADGGRTGTGGRFVGSGGAISSGASGSAGRVASNGGAATGGTVSDAGAAPDAGSDAGACFRVPERDGAVCTADVCLSSADVYHVTVTSNGEWIGLFWSLTICDHVFGRATEADPSHMTFSIDAADFETLRPGSPISMFYGNPSPSTSRAASCGVLHPGPVRLCL